MDKQTISAMAIGTVLKEQRESIKLSQQDVANKLNYKNYNYISMLENGRSSIPVKRLHDIFNAYQFDKEVFAVFVKRLLPDVWEVMMQVTEKEKLPSTKDDIEKFEVEIDQRFKQLLMKFGLEKYSNLIDEL